MAGEGEQVEEGDAEQDLHGEGDVVLQMVGSDIAEDLPIHQPQPGQGPTDEAGRQGKDEEEPQQFVLHLAQEPEGQPGDGGAAKGGREQMLEGVDFLGGLEFFQEVEDQFAREIDAGGSAAEDAQVGERGTFEQKEQQIGNQLAADANPFANLEEPGDEQAENQAAQGGEVDAQEADVQAPRVSSPGGREPASKAA